MRFVHLKTSLQWMMLAAISEESEGSYAELAGLTIQKKSNQS